MKKDNLKITVIDHENGYIGPSCQRGFQKLGYTVQLLLLKGEEGTKIMDFFDLPLLLSEVIHFGPDLILDINGKACDRDGISLTAFRILNIPVFIWFVDNPLIPLNYGSYKYSHLFTKLVYDRFQCEEMKQLGISNTFHLPLGVDDDYFKPLHLEPSDEEQYRADISFVGHSYADRCAILRNNVLRNRWPDMPAEMNVVIEHCIRQLINGTKKNTHHVLQEALELYCFNPAYPQNDIEWVINIIIEHESGRDYRASLIRPLLKYGIKIYGNKSWSLVLGDYNISPQVHYFNELPKVYNASSINLNISRTQLVTAVNQRVFDVPACRSFLLTDFKEELEEYFEIGKEIICYKDQDDLDRLVSFYLNSPSHRNSVSVAGYERVLAEHTYAHRMKRLVDLYKGLPEYNYEFIKNGETWEKAHLSIGQAYLKLGYKDKAMFHFNRSFNRESGTYICNLNSAGISLLQNKQYVDCIPLFKAASEMDPDELSFLSNLGLCYQNTGQYEEAVAIYKKALEKDPSYTIAISNLEGLCKKIKKDAGANNAISVNRCMNHPGISLCMIVKNEEQNLARCLNSVRRVISELIIVDTGSTDRTVDIAKENNAKLLQFKWNDNFSDARNVSLESAEGEWILILDADEIIAEEDLDTLKIMCDSKEYGAFIFLTRNYTNDSNGAKWVPNDNSYKEGSGYAGWFPSRKVRLFKNDKRIRFSGAVHELVEHSIMRFNLRTGEADIPIHHYGASESVLSSMDKKVRYLDYCRKKIEEEPDNPKAFYEYGLLCSGRGLHEDAEKSFKRVLKLNSNFPLVDGCLGASLISLGYFKEAIPYLEKGIVKEPDNPGLYNNLASAYYELGIFDKAIDLYKQAIGIHPGYASGYKNLGLVYLKTGKISHAVGAFEKALSINPSMDDVAGLIDELEKGYPKKEYMNSIIPVNTGKLRLSLCMIVKNEEAVLKSCLESVSGIVDEIIIVDTGSKDNTCEIASSYGAKIIYSPWADDFSIPRNLSVHNATGDYILWLDADEEISTESRKGLLNLKYNFPENKEDAYSVIIRSKRNDKEEESFRRLRIFPRNTGIKFNGRVHEDITESIKDSGIKIKPVDIIVDHYGYKDDKEIAAKIKRNLPMLIKQHEDLPGDLLTIFYLANSFYCLGDIAQAVKYMEKVTLYSSKVCILNNEWYPFAFIKLAQFYRELDKQEEVIKVYQDLFGLFPDFSAGHFFFGEALFFQGKYKEALKEFKDLLEQEIEAGEFPIPLRKIEYLKYYYSGCCFVELGEYVEAAEYFSKAMEINPDALTLHVSASRLFALSGDIQLCIEACNKVLTDIDMEISDKINTIKDLSRIFDLIGSSLETMSLPHEAMEAYKTALVLTNNI